MENETLWAPWRLSYITGEKPQTNEAVERHWLPGADQDCFVCRAVAESRDRENLVVLRGDLSVVILNRFPYNNGHLLVAPIAHRGTLGELSSAEHLELMETITRMVGHLEQLIAAQGFNVGLNLGRIAGAGLPGHLHWHIVPRWSGDTNFMPALAGVRVIPQSLDELYRLLVEATEVKGTA